MSATVSSRLTQLANFYHVPFDTVTKMALKQTNNKGRAYFYISYLFIIC